MFERAGGSVSGGKHALKGRGFWRPWWRVESCVVSLALVGILGGMEEMRKECGFDLWVLGRWICAWWRK